MESPGRGALTPSCCRCPWCCSLIQHVGSSLSNTLKHTHSRHLVSVLCKCAGLCGLNCGEVPLCRVNSKFTLTAISALHQLSDHTLPPPAAPPLLIGSHSCHSTFTTPDWLNLPAPSAAWTNSSASCVQRAGGGGGEAAGVRPTDMGEKEADFWEQSDTFSLFVLEEEKNNRTCLIFSGPLPCLSSYQSSDK